MLDLKVVDLVDLVDMVKHMSTATSNHTEGLEFQKEHTLQLKNQIERLRVQLEDLLSQARSGIENHGGERRKQGKVRTSSAERINQPGKSAARGKPEALPVEKQMSELILEVFRASPATTAGVIAALSTETKFDPHEAGLALVRQMQKAEGGAWTGAELHAHFDLTSATLHRRRAEHRTIFWRDAKEVFHYPKWQFTPTGALLPGLQEVLQTFRSSDEWRIMRYFLMPRQQLDNQPPLALLQRGEEDKVIAHARIHGQENTW